MILTERLCQLMGLVQMSLPPADYGSLLWIGKLCLKCPHTQKKYRREVNVD